MFTNRYTAFVNASSLVGALKRNMLLTLAEAGFFRLCWSKEVLDETERALARIFTEKGEAAPELQANRQRRRMEEAFEDAMVDHFDEHRAACSAIPDRDDMNIVAAALKVQAATLVTENLKHFLDAILAPLNLEARSAVTAVRRMRRRFKKPDMAAEDLLIRMEAVELTETVDMLCNYVSLL